jgi:DNA modification methylase
MIADPPYNVGFNYANITDDKDAQEWKEFCSLWFSVCSEKPRGSIVTPGPRNERLYPEPRDKGIWAKKYATAGASCFHLRVCEPILFYGKFDKKRNTDLFEYSSGFSKELTSARLGAGVAEQHPPAKSMPLWLELVGMLGNVVFDPFGGNGTTLMACENLNKKGRMIEIYPAYCAVILERMSQAFPELVIQRENNE